MDECIIHIIHIRTAKGAKNQTKTENLCNKQKKLINALRTTTTKKKKKRSLKTFEIFEGL